MNKVNEESIVDAAGQTIHITKDNWVLVDGHGVFRCIERDGVLYVRFRDKNQFRYKCRGSQFIEIPLHILVEKITQVQTKEKSNGRTANPAQS